METNLPEINFRQAQSIPVRLPACLPDILSIRQQQQTPKTAESISVRLRLLTLAQRLTLAAAAVARRLCP